VIAAKGGKSRLGRRIVQIELNLDSGVSAILTLLRKGKTLATKQIATVRAGNPVLTLLVPVAVGKGKATLRLQLTNPAGDTFSARRGVSIPAK
jgi:hypothetical protein